MPGQKGIFPKRNLAVLLASHDLPRKRQMKRALFGVKGEEEECGGKKQEKKPNFTPN